MEYMVNLERIASDYNATIHHRDFGDPNDRDSIDGIVVKYHSRFHIGVNERLSEYEKNSVAMHEIGHIETGTVGIVGSLICERMCDEWALEKMIPEEKLKEALDWYGEDCEFLPQLFGVDGETMKLKCKKLCYSL